MGTVGGVLLHALLHGQPRHAALIDVGGVVGIVGRPRDREPVVRRRRSTDSVDGVEQRAHRELRARRHGGRPDRRRHPDAQHRRAEARRSRRRWRRRSTTGDDDGIAARADDDDLRTCGDGRMVELRAMETASSACPLDCPDLCGLTVTVDDGRVVEVDGDRRGPLTDGFICGKVRKIADHLYGDDRVLASADPHGPKGSGAVGAGDAGTRRSTAIAGAASRRSARARGGEAILPYHYGGSNGWLTEGALATRFFRRLGASNLERTFCAAATTAATRGLYGVMPGVALEDYAHAKLIVLWGVNPSATGIHLVPVIERAREAGAKLVVVDPRATPLARRADLHLALRPGHRSAGRARGDPRAVRARPRRPRVPRRARDRRRRARARRAARVVARRGRARGAASMPALLERFVELYAASIAGGDPLRLGPRAQPQRRQRGRGGARAARGRRQVRRARRRLHDVQRRRALDASAPRPRSASRRRRRAPINMSELAQRAARRCATRAIECLFVYNCNPVATAPDQRARRSSSCRATTCSSSSTSR